MNEDPSTVPRHTQIDIQLLRIIANSNTGASLGPARIYGAYHNNRNQSSNVNYSRLFLGQVVNQEEGDKLVYLVESHSTNNSLWKRNPQLRDDGVITIGTIIRVLAPLPIKNLMANDVPMLETRFPVVVMMHPRELVPKIVNEGLGGNESRAFVMNNCTVDIASSVPEETRCSGLLCDKQGIHEITARNQGCGCYYMLSRRSNLVIDHSLNIRNIRSNAVQWNCYIENFSSNKFSMLYQSSPFPSSLRADALQLTDEYWNLVEAIDNVVELINDNGGFTIVGWYKRGLINDQSIIADNSNTNRGSNDNTDNQVDNGSISYHVCQMRATNIRFYIEGTPLSDQLGQLRYDMGRLHSGGD